MASVAKVTVPAGGVVGLFDAAGVSPALAEVRVSGGGNSSTLAAVTSDSDHDDTFGLSGNTTLLTDEEFYVKNTGSEPIVLTILVIPRAS